MCEIANLGKFSRISYYITHIVLHTFENTPMDVCFHLCFSKTHVNLCNTHVLHTVFFCCEVCQFDPASVRDEVLGLVAAVAKATTHLTKEMSLSPNLRPTRLSSLLSSRALC
jgi:hypothetical protein